MAKIFKKAEKRYYKNGSYDFFTKPASGYFPFDISFPGWLCFLRKLLI